MASAISGAVPVTNSALTSAEIRAQFGAAASEITTLQNQVTPLQTNVGTLQTTVTGLQTTAAPLASPSLTGTPTAPTAAVGTNTTQLATTAFVAAAVTAAGGGMTVPQADLRYLQLTGGTIRNPGNTTTLNIAADAGSYETLLGFPHAGAPTNWDVGVGTAGNFRIRDTVGTPPIRFDITPTGLVQIARSVAVGTGLADMGVGTINATAYYQNGTLFTGGTGGGLPTTGGDLTGALGINTSGTSSANLPAGPAVSDTVVHVASNSNTALVIDSAGPGQVSRIQLRRAGGPTPGSFGPPLVATPTASQLGMIEFLGWNGASYTGGAIQCRSTAAFSSTAAPIRMDFQTTRTGTTALSVAMYIGPSGGFVVGTPGGADMGAGSINAQSINVDGNININGEISLNGDPFTNLAIGAPNSGGAGYRALVVPN